MHGNENDEAGCDEFKSWFKWPEATFWGQLIKVGFLE